jgi:CDP-ribitol ribitolphosphotransferase
MNFKYKLFAIIFNIFNFFPIKKDEISFIIEGNSFDGNLKHIKEELDTRGYFKYNFIYKDKFSFNNIKSFKFFFEMIFFLLEFFIIKTYKLAKSKYIFLNDNFFPMAYMNFSEDTLVIQIWHAPGAFKKFGFEILEDNNIKDLFKLIGSKINYLFISSNNVSEIYQNAFCVDKNKVLALGTPRIDYYFNKDNNNSENIMKIKNKFEKIYPEIKDKKIVLYAPTFRTNKKLNNNISNHFNGDLFQRDLGDKYCLFFKSHPKFNISKIDNSIDVSEHENLQELLLISDILITDYSSVMVEYSILSKPIIFYPFDLNYYYNHERGFYFDYNNVPGPIAKNTMDIINIIQNNDFDIEKIDSFAYKNHEYLDDKSSKRIIDYLFGKE